MPLKMESIQNRIIGTNKCSTYKVNSGNDSFSDVRFDFTRDADWATKQESKVVFSMPESVTSSDVNLADPRAWSKMCQGLLVKQNDDVLIVGDGGGNESQKGDYFLCF
tara:strand:- start:587 stop:910 length:324 start_codon:yes stop_codon:yes gene_type:complete